MEKIEIHKNINCLAGMSCPTCGNDDKVFIEVTQTYEVTDDGAAVVDADLEWDDHSPCRCKCGFRGTVGDFKSNQNQEAKPAATRKIKAKVQMKCSACGSTDVRRDAYAAWSVDRQEWELVTVFDNADCENCDGKCSLVTEPA